MDNLIYKFINQSVRNVDTYRHNGSTWLIFTNDNKWVIELTKDNILWYNYSFFNSIFGFFSMDVIDNQSYITKWVEDNIINRVEDIESSKYQSNHEVEDVIKNGVKRTVPKSIADSFAIEDTIQNGVKETNPVDVMKFFDNKMEDTLQNGVKETQFNDNENKSWVEGVIKGGVKETKTPGNGDIVSTVEWMKENNSNSYPKMIDDVINNGVKEVYWLPNEHKLPVDDVNPVDDVIDNGEKINGTFVGGSRQKENVEVVIDYGVKETHDDVYHHKGRIEGVIKCGKIII